METLMKRALDIAHLFDVPRGEMACEPYGTGNINDTFCLTVRPWTGAARRYILQRVNRYVFPDPEPMMGNIQRVTHYLRGVIAREGGDPARETLTLVRAMDGRPWITDVSGDLWRVYLFIEGTVSTDMPDSPETFAAAGEAFGRFQRQLGGFDAATLHPTLPDFHNTPARLQQLTNAIGRKGQNVKLAARLLGWKVDIFTETRYNEANAIGHGLEQVASVAEVSMNQLLEAGYTSLDLLRQATDEELSDKLAISDSRIADLRSAINFLAPVAEPEPRAAEEETTDAGNGEKVQDGDED